MSVAVFSNSAAVVGWGDYHIQITYGEAWFADDPFVLANPGLFTVDPPRIRSSVGREVEAATANPGERRTVRRG